MDVLDLLDPHQLYNSRLKQEHKENSEKYFDELVKKSAVDEYKNEVIVKEIKDNTTLYNEVDKKIKRKSALKTFLIILTILFFVIPICLIAYIVNTEDNIALNIVISVILVALAILFIVLLVKKINPKLKELRNERSRLENRIKDLKNEAYLLLSPLNSLFDYNLSAELVSKTAPVIKMDKYFDLEKYEYLHEKYGFNDNEDNSQSATYVQSGEVNGNPFLLEKIKFQRMIKHTYTGHLTVTWTETRRVNGKSQTVTRSQTLYANVVADKPDYYDETWLVYGNDAAPNLSFTRFPSKATGKDEKEIDKLVEKGEKKLDKLAEETLMDDIEGEYVKLGNVEFDVIFGAQDRDNELEFRLLFTPLAQNNILKIIKDTKPFGDDFFIEKKKCLNYVYSYHNDRFAYDVEPSYFEGYDLKAMKENFVSYNVKYFESFFYTIAPLLCIPLYQQQKPLEYIYKRDYKSNFTTLEHEVLANKFSYDNLRPSDASTDLILKTNLVKKNKESDTIQITAHSFRGEPRLSYVPRVANNGRTYMVPVHWVEYFPTSKTSTMEVMKSELKRVDYLSKTRDNDYISLIRKYSGINPVYKNGLLSLLLDRYIDNEDDINKIKAL